MKTRRPLQVLLLGWVLKGQRSNTTRSRGHNEAIVGWWFGKSLHTEICACMCRCSVLKHTHAHTHTNPTTNTVSSSSCSEFLFLLPLWRSYPEDSASSHLCACCGIFPWRNTFPWVPNYMKTTILPLSVLTNETLSSLGICVQIHLLDYEIHPFHQLLLSVHNSYQGAPPAEYQSHILLANNFIMLSC